MRTALLGAAGTAAGPLAVVPAAWAAGQHPFLLVSPGDFATLRDRAATDPWKTWATAAVTLAGTTYVKKPAAPGEPGEPDVGKRAKQMAQIAGSASLAYILDTANSGAHRQKILDLIQTYGSDIYPYLDSFSWQGTVAPSGALFHLVIGFDVIYDTLTVNQVSEAEQVLSTAAGWFYTYRNNTSWQAARIGGYGIWAAFKKDADTLQAARLSESVTQLRNRLAAVTESDGAYLTGPNYAGYRLGSPGDRDSKSYFVDVLTRIGAYNFYADTTYRKLMEHYSGYLTTPVLRPSKGRDEFTFGDSWAAGGAVYRSARTYSADRFGPVAAAGAGWSLRGVPASATLPLITAYALTTQAPQTTATVASRVFRGAGAWFYQSSTSNLALAGALWCPKKTNAVEHQHKDTNALHLTAYGEHVLRNSGYAGYLTAAAGFSYEVISRRAVVNNTALLDYDAEFDDYNPPTSNDHVTATSSLPGAGVVEDLLWKDLDYACGDSGGALPNGTHRRSFVFVHPNATCHGYWLVFDEVDAKTGNVPASIAWHPNSKTDPQVVTAGTEYVSLVDVNPCTTNNVKLSVFLATPPAGVSVRSGPFAESVVPSVAGRYLYCSYPTDSAGVKRVVTVLFPFDDYHAKATMRRVSGSGFTGASITHAAGPVDYALESNGTTAVSVQGVTWRGLATVFRLAGGNLDHYLVRRGNSFVSGGLGFTASANVSVNCKGKGGRIRNGNAGQVSVTFYHPGLTKVRLNGIPAAVTASGIGWLTVTVPAGTWQFELVTQ